MLFYTNGEDIVERLGGSVVVADALKIHRSTAWKWTQPKEKGGTGGLIPSKHVPALLALAKKRRTKITAKDFYPNMQLR